MASTSETTSKNKVSKFDIDTDLVRKLADLLEETNLGEIEFADGEKRLRLTRGGSAPIVAPAPVAVAPAAAAPAVNGSADAAPEAHPGALLSPMVGTLYMAPEPGAADFVKVGDSVSEGQTVFIIEAMKVMNPIKAHKSGKVTQILVENEQPIEFGEALLIIE